MVRRAANNNEFATFVGVIAAACTAFATFLCVAPALAQFGTPAFTDTSFGNIFGVASQKLSYIDKNGSPVDRGKSCSEMLRGNGTRAGYSLSHGGIIPDSVSVSVGAHRLRPNLDYYLDATSGSIGFAEPVRRLETVSVGYRHIEGQDGARSPLAGLSGLTLNLKGSALNFGLGVSTSASGLDFTTYGLAMNSTTGSGSTLNSLFYFSTPNANKNNLVGNTREALTASAAKAQSEEAKSDHLIAQNLLLKSGSATLRATYQDVGLHFNGFQAMKQANAKNTDVMTQIGALEKEKGVKRMGFGAGLQTGKTGNLGFDWDTVSDGKDSITKQGLGYQSKLFNLKYSEQQVGDKFAKFQNLREAEAAQWAKEKGVKRTDLTLGMAAGKDGQFGYSASMIGDKTGAIKRDLISFGSKSLNFSLSSRKTDNKFARIKDLSDADRTNLALDIRRQFNPNAAAAEVTAQDKVQAAGETGLSRSRMSLGGTLGKKSAFAFNQFSIDDSKGKIQRQTISLNGKSFSLNYLDQTVSDSFSRLTTMSDFEKLQFGNEKGIHRQTLGLNLTSSRSSTFLFSQLSLSDKKAGMTRQSMAYAAKGIDLKVNMVNMDSKFDRIGDLAGFTPPEKAAMEAERGYKRMDWSANLTSIKGLTLSTYNYDAHNDTDKLDKSIYRHNLAWTGSKLTQITFLSEGKDLQKDGKPQDGVAHELLNLNQQFGKGTKLNFYRETSDTVVGGKASPTVTTDFLHLETDKAKANNLLTETKRTDLGSGKFENTTLIDMNYRTSKSMTLHLNKLGIDRGKDPSADTTLLDWKWQMSKTFNFTGAYAETTTNNQTNATVKSFAATGMVTKNLNLTGTYSEIDQHKKNVKAVSDVAISNVKPIKILGLKNVTFTGRYASVNDQQKQQSQNASAKVQGMLGKNQFGMEYSSVLNPNGTNAIARIITVVTDPDVKLPFHLDVLYKARTTNRGNVDLVRKYNAVYRMDKATNVTYAYLSLPEDAATVMQPTKSSVFCLKRAIDRTLNLGVDYTTAKQLAAKNETSKLGALLNGKVDKLSSVEVGYSVDIATIGALRTDARIVKIGYDHQVDGDHFISVSTSFKENKGAPDEMLANIDFKTRF